MTKPAPHGLYTLTLVRLKKVWEENGVKRMLMIPKLRGGGINTNHVHVHVIINDVL